MVSKWSMAFVWRFLFLLLWLMVELPLKWNGNRYVGDENVKLKRYYSIILVLYFIICPHFHCRFLYLFPLAPASSFGFCFFFHFVPIDSPKEEQLKGLNMYLETEQKPKTDVRHWWFSSFLQVTHFICCLLRSTRLPTACCSCCCCCCELLFTLCFVKSSFCRLLLVGLLHWASPLVAHYSVLVVLSGFCLCLAGLSMELPISVVRDCHRALFHFIIKTNRRHMVCMQFEWMLRLLHAS